MSANFNIILPSDVKVYFIKGRKLTTILEGKPYILRHSGMGTSYQFVVFDTTFIAGWLRGKVAVKNFRSSAIGYIAEVYVRDLFSPTFAPIPITVIRKRPDDEWAFYEPVIADCKPEVLAYNKALIQAEIKQLNQKLSRFDIIKL